MKHKLWVAGVAVVLLVIGIIGAANAFFVNQEIFDLSIGLILLSLLTLITVVSNVLIDKFTVLSVKRKWGFSLTIILIILISLFSLGSAL